MESNLTKAGWLLLIVAVLTLYSVLMTMVMVGRTGTTISSSGSIIDFRTDSGLVPG